MKKLLMLLVLLFLFGTTSAWNWNFTQENPPIEEDLGTWLYSPQTDYVIYLNATNPYDPTVPGYYISTTSNDRCHNPILACVEVMGTNANAHDCRNYQIQSPDSFMPWIAFRADYQNYGCPIHDTDPNNPTEVSEAENGGGGPGGLGVLNQPAPEVLHTDTQTYADLNPGPTEIKSAVAWMYENGLTSKSTVDLFMPGKEITREEAAKFFSVFATEILGKTPDTSLPCTFSDLGGATPDLVDDIILSCQLGLFKGYQGHFNPLDNIKINDSQIVMIRSIYGLLPEVGANYWSAYRAKGVEIGLFADRQRGNNLEMRGNIAIYMYEYQFPQYRNNQNGSKGE